MKKLTVFLSYVLVAALAAFGALMIQGTVVSVGSSGSSPAAAQAAAPSKLDQLLEHIETYYIGEVDRKALEDAAADAMVQALGDQWSHYFTEAELDAYLEDSQNAYVGVGITVSRREDGYRDVLKVDAGGPAQEAGLLAGDIILEVDGKDISDLDDDQMRDLVRGEVGSKVSLTVKRQDTRITAEMVRRQIQVQVAYCQMLDDKVGLVKILDFGERSAKETLDCIRTLQDQGAQALIFDVRNNPGGYRDEMVEILDYLLPEGPIFHSERYDGVVEVDQSDAKCLDIPMAVLINQDSYSAAEFFAAALEEYDMAVTVGQPTTGKGRFQVTSEFSDGSGIMLSIGRYTTPKGVDLTGVGLTPNVPVEVDMDTALAIYAETLPFAEDPQVQAAIKALDLP